MTAVIPRCAIAHLWARSCASPESITTTGSMDSGPAPLVGYRRPKAHPGMTNVSSIETTVEHVLPRHHRRRLDLHACRLFDQTHHLDQRHGRIMRAEDV